MADPSKKISGLLNRSGIAVETSMHRLEFVFARLEAQKNLEFFTGPESGQGTKKSNSGDQCRMDKANSIELHETIPLECQAYCMATLSLLALLAQLDGSTAIEYGK